MKELTIDVSGMHCPGCETLLQDSLEETDGIASAVVSHSRGTAMIRYDERKVDAALVRSIIEKEGYGVR
ncbi:heavy-metal-associated domain-containing protein [Candidatus Woesearchaeota archaeon]|nr:heavy-metal-associated domain-containing protein [Candidatus Woesearchaeota archaeon]